MDYFRLLHDYDKLVRRNMANPLTCKQCNTEFTVRMHDEEPYLKCYGCGGRLKPGTKMYNEIRHIVETRLK